MDYPITISGVAFCQGLLFSNHPNKHQAQQEQEELCCVAGRCVWVCACSSEQCNCNSEVVVVLCSMQVQVIQVGCESCLAARSCIVEDLGLYNKVGDNPAFSLNVDCISVVVYGQINQVLNPFRGFICTSFIQFLDKQLMYQLWSRKWVTIGLVFLLLLKEAICAVRIDC